MKKMKLKTTILQTTCLLALLGVMGCATDQKTASNPVTPEEAVFGHRAVAKSAL
jgi:hypothetical protein